MAPEGALPPDIPVTAAATFCATLVDEWRAQGLRDAVISPGSRSTPMAMALADVDGARSPVGASDGTMRMHVCLDERSAGFLALGLARASGWPVVVLTTSGTATTNLHPAVVEAHQDAVPLLVLTADRPPELHGIGAPQTIDQQQLYGGAVRTFIDAGVPEDSDPMTWRALAGEVWDQAAGGLRTPPGPVQLNLPFREPLTGRQGSLPERPPRLGRSQRVRDEPAGDLASRLPGARVLVVAGPAIHDHELKWLLESSARLNWPVLLDPRLGALSGPVTQLTTANGALLSHDPSHGDVTALGLRRADLLVRSTMFVRQAAPEVVLRFGALPASKVLGSWLDGLGAYQVGVDRWGRTFDPGGSLDRVWTRSPQWIDEEMRPTDRGADEDWLSLWRSAEASVEHALDEAFAHGPLTEPLVARLVSTVARDLRTQLVVSSSMPIRDVEWFGVPDGPPIHANRGANGIDGVVSTAAGVALARLQSLAEPNTGTPTIALLGDLAFLHDTNGLLILNSEQPDLTLVVVDNGGGGIFHFLPQRDALDAARFEYLYGTPHGLDLVAVAEAHGVPAQRCNARDAFEAALRATTKGPRVLVVTTDRDANVAQHRRLQDLVVAAVNASLRPQV